MLEGKAILISGAASGIGRAAAKLFASYGARLLLVDRNADALSEAASETASPAFVADVADSAAMHEAVREALARFGALHGAFNNAGIEQSGGRMAPLAEIPAADFAAVVSVNLTGMFNAMQAEIPAMCAQGGGAIVNTASVMGWLGAPGLSAYVASKHGVVGLTRSAALDYARAGIRVNAVLPGAVETPMLTERGFKANPGFAEAAPSLHPIGRLAQPKEIAEAAAWLLSDKASFVTGHTLAVDGGLSAA